MTTGDDGAYRMPALRPGHYNVKIEKEGFKTVTETALTLDVTQELVVNSALEIGSAAQGSDGDRGSSGGQHDDQQPRRPGQ